jgi:hypothetical protein
MKRLTLPAQFALACGAVPGLTGPITIKGTGTTDLTPA